MTANEPEVRDDSIGMERIIFFSDAVIAIAITLLVIDIKVPELGRGQTDAAITQAVFSLWPKVLSFLLSFWVIAVYWVAHHRSFRWIQRYDSRLIFLNLLFLLFIAWVPVPTALLYTYPSHTLVVSIYAGSMAAIGLSKFWLWRYAVSKRLTVSDLTPADVHVIDRNMLAAPLVFLLSIGVALFNADLAMYSWVVLAPITYLLRFKQKAR